MIYIVVFETGSYDDYSHSNRAAFLDKTLAEAYIEEQKERVQRLYKEHLDLAEFVRNYIAENPYPNRPNMIRIQGEASSRQKIIKENQFNAKKYCDQMATWNEKCFKAQANYASERGYEIPEFLISYAACPDKDDVWSIEELELKG